MLKGNRLHGEVYVEPYKKDPYEFFIKNKTKHEKGEVMQVLPKIGCDRAENKHRHGRH